MYAAKFELLQAGLLVEAEEISDIINVKPRKKGDDEEGINVDEELDVDAGSVDSIISRIDNYLKKVLSGVGRISKKVCFQSLICILIIAIIFYLEHPLY
jgi:hypothetical protein